MMFVLINNVLIDDIQHILNAKKSNSISLESAVQFQQSSYKILLKLIQSNE